LDARNATRRVVRHREKDRSLQREHSNQLTDTRDKRLVFVWESNSAILYK
jgi:hypothetical protein